MKNVFIVAAAFAMIALPIFGAAQPDGSIVKVNRCAPEENLKHITTGDYVAGYYPPHGRYYWNDPYGRRYYQYPVSTTTTSHPELAIDFVNVSSTPINNIDFGLVAKGYVVAEVRDVGTFAPGAEIKHRFGLNPNVFPLGTGLAQCVPLHATFANGTAWTSPHLPQLKR
jgi:hypothetical protein